MTKPVVRIYTEGVLPRYVREGDAGMDVCALESCVIESGKTALIKTGIYMELPHGMECQVRPRSGLALKYGITVLNSPGTIDSGYRGECNVILINHSNILFVVDKGMRIAQFVFARHETVEFEQVSSQDALSDTSRGGGGFGHTGV